VNEERRGKISEGGRRGDKPRKEKEKHLNGQRAGKKLLNLVGRRKKGTKEPALTIRKLKKGKERGRTS